MAKSKHTPLSEARELADSLARRIAESVPSASTYSATIADTIFAALTEPEPEHSGSAAGALDTE